MALPLKQFRELVKKSPTLSLNLLQATNLRSTGLLAELVKLKLSDSKQKLGQFLLGRAFEKGQGKQKVIKLKYDKSVVASYLGINPETLSRTLKKLKNDGEITVTKNEITLLTKSSLCKYCNQEIATKCNFNSYNFCTQK